MSIGTPENKPPRLVSDIGGTHARFALSTSVDDIREVSVVKVADYSSIEDAIKDYLRRIGNPVIEHAAIGIANPIVGDHVKMTNFQWEFSIDATRVACGFQTLHFINDFTALALALPHLPQHELRAVGNGQAVAGTPLGVVGPGTGLGVSALIPTSQGWIPLAAEGGHVSFAPTDDLELALWHEARAEFGHVSMERLVSGSGLQFIYHTLCQRAGIQAHDYSAPDISRRAIANTCEHCREALDAFCAILGTAASNLALMLGARGGIYIGGGIVPRLGDYFFDSPFRGRFNDKGRFSDYLAAIPVFVISSENPALAGAAAYLDSCINE
ncbi:glucokinase [Pollutimonas nitritireducens]|uniref:Glucokinase n=1 Tax=Pollutimonas nitritireducens TaxID=2045209 RepID=A0A2N4UJP0_9BURK|nr:glucokinase [Pollutimonas nitritireducens]PLC55220.1 glucokinase [Pollutimonas nitritireducens]